MTTTAFRNDECMLSNDGTREDNEAGGGDGWTQAQVQALHVMGNLMVEQHRETTLSG